MKKITTLLFVLSVLVYSSKATTITADDKDGVWAKKGTWNLNRVPKTGDTILIPTGYTVTMRANEDYNTVYIRIYGNLVLDKSSKLTLGSASKIYVSAGGRITSANDNKTQVIKINTTSVFTGTSNDIVGPVMLTTAGSLAVSEIPLPVRFVSFDLSLQQKNVVVEWATAQENNSAYFEIERSENNADWVSIGKIKAAGESTILLNYSFTDKNVSGTSVYYRIKQVDLDGKFIYTSIKPIKLDNNQIGVKVVSVSKNNLMISFSQQVKSNVAIRLVSSSGQVLEQQVVSNPVGQVAFSTHTNSAGMYIVNITDNHNLVISKQVIL